MKRGIVALVLVFASGVLANVVYTSAKPEKSDERCSMDWLARELRLDAAQYDAVFAIHRAQCAQICRLGSAVAHCAPADVPRVEAECRAATMKLVADVSAQLSPTQREKYLQLVAPCLTSAGAAGR